MTCRSFLLKTSKLACAECELHRRTCDLSGKLGSLYDIRTDSFVKHNPPLQEPIYYDINPIQTCTWWWFDDKKDITGLLDMLEIENELCLSLYVGMGGIERNGRASLINYDKPIDSQTLFLLYSCSTSKQSLPTDSHYASSFFSNKTFDKLNVNATHIVCKIVRGFEVLFVIHVGNTTDGMNCDICIAGLLNKICDILQQNVSMKINLTQDEQDLWAKLNVNIQASSPQLTINQSKNVISIIRRIQHFQDSWSTYEHPLIYTFQPVEWIYSTETITNCNYFQNSHPQQSKKIQRKLYLLQNVLNTLSISLQFLIKIDQNQQLSRQSKDIHRKLQDLRDLRDELLRNLRSTLCDVRRCTKSFHTLSEILEEPQYNSLYRKTIKPLIKECDHLCGKVRLIDQLTNQHFQYQQIQDEDNPSKKEQISKLFINSSQPVYILCSSDTFIKQNENLWNSCRQQLIKKKNDDSTVRLVFADLSYCKHEDIKETTIISLDDQTAESIPSTTEQVIEKTDINVLLLGESGVGKSTFINAFVNYLTFDSLEQAAAGEPVILIPVSFLLTITDKFEEFVVKFGDVDSNEDHDHPGQSVTQYCKSYVFDISNKSRLRLIDTPGIGDTRGLEQDMINIDQILSYMNNFSHINAICILLQPNATRLNVFFRTCILQLFTYLTQAARDNIIFCFTNTRLTFFAPGNTAPTLKSFLKELPISDIPFIKKNSFCFDSESFRYLAAVKNNVQFSKHHQQECNKSWVASVTESERLLKFIHTLKPYYMSRWQSEKHAKLEIYTMIRPIMEVFRKVLITQIMQNQSRSNVTMVLDPKSIDIPSVICNKGECSIKLVKCDILKIVQYPLHQLSNMKINSYQQCNSCQCSQDKHMITDYELKYKFLTVTKPTKSIKDADINWWLKLCLQFAFFIGSIDPFILHFDRFIDETQAFASPNQKAKKSEYIGNVQMNEKLAHIRTYFVEYAQKNSVKWKPDLAEIYQYIADAMAVQDIKSQINAIKQSRLTILKNEEQHVEKPSRSTGILYRIIEQSTEKYGHPNGLT